MKEVLSRNISFPDWIIAKNRSKMQSSPVQLIKSESLRACTTKDWKWSQNQDHHISNTYEWCQSFELHLEWFAVMLFLKNVLCQLLLNICVVQYHIDEKICTWKHHLCALKQGKWVGPSVRTVSELMRLHNSCRTLSKNDLIHLLYTSRLPSLQWSFVNVRFLKENPKHFPFCYFPS